MPQIEIATMPPLQRGASRLPVLSCRRCVRGERLMAFVVSRDGRPTEERRPHEQLADAGVRGRAGVPPAHLFVSLLCAERTFCCSAAGGGGQPGRPYLRADLKQVSVDSDPHKWLANVGSQRAKRRSDQVFEVWWLGISERDARAGVV